VTTKNWSWLLQLNKTMKFLVCHGSVRLVLNVDYFIVRAVGNVVVLVYMLTGVLDGGRYVSTTQG